MNNLTAHRVPPRENLTYTITNDPCEHMNDIKIEFSNYFRVVIINTHKKEFKILCGYNEEKMIKTVSNFTSADSLFYHLTDTILPNNQISIHGLEHMNSRWELFKKIEKFYLDSMIKNDPQTRMIS